MLKSKGAKFITLMFLIMTAILSFVFLGQSALVSADSASVDRKEEVTNNGEFLLASSDTASNLVSANLESINSITDSSQKTSTSVYSVSGISGSANTEVWGISFHSALATKISNAIQFTNPVEISGVDSITIRMFVHLSPTQGVYHTDMGGVMLSKLSETNCRKNTYSHTLSRSITQDQWIDYKISGSELAKLVETDGTIKGIQFASDTRGSNSSNFYTGTPNQKQSYIYVDYVYYTEIQKNAVDEMRENGLLLASANSGDYEFVDKKLVAFDGYKQVPGTAGKSAPEISVVQGESTNDAGDTTFDWTSFTEGMIGNYAFRVPFHSDSTSLHSPAIKFNQKVKASEIGGITIRMYARLSDSDTYQTTYGGIQLFGLESEGYTEGYMIPENIEQNKWIELVLLPEQVALLADPDGYVSGIQIGAAFHSTHADFLYQATPSQGEKKPAARIWIEYVSVAKSVGVTYKSDGIEIKKSNVFTGASIDDAFIPEKAGHVFCGWYNEKDKLYDFSGVIYGETVLNAKWETAKDASTIKGLYKTTGQGNYGKNNTYLYIDDNGEIDFSDISSADPLVYGVTASDEIYAVNKDFSVNKFKLGGEYAKVDDADVVTVTYQYEVGSKSIRVEKGEQLKNYTVDRAGYILSKWVDEDDVAVDFSNLTVLQNSNFIAVWEYDQVSDTLYKFYYADYYCKENQAILSLKAENKATLSSQTVKNGEFYILKPGVIVLIFDGVKTENTIYAQRIVLNDNTTFVRLNEYIITFNTTGGSKIDDFIVTGGNHKVSKPEDPTREGYVFKGWITSDGAEYNFDQIVMSSTTLYAVWEKIETTEEQLKEGMKGYVIALIVGGGVLVAGGGVASVMLLRKKRVK